MKGIEDWDEAKQTFKRGDMIRLMLGNAKWLEGLWSGDSIMVSNASQTLRHEVEKDDLIGHNGAHGFVRVRLNHRNLTIPNRSFMLLALDYISGAEEHPNLLKEEEE